MSFKYFAAALIATAAPISVRAGLLTSDSWALTVAAPCYTETGSSCIPSNPVVIHNFGSVSAGGFNSTGGLDNARANFFHNVFGLDASGAVNRVVAGGGGQAGGYAYGTFQDSLLVPAQPGLALGDPGTLNLNFHLHGAMSVVSDGSPGPGVRFKWSLDYGPDSSVNNTALNVNWFWNTNGTRNINQDFVIPIPFTVGTIFYVLMSVEDSAWFQTSGIDLGSAEGDFIHTGTMLPAVVLDKNSNPVSNPIVLSDTGFDYVNPAGTPASTTPEPSSATLVVVAVSMLAAASLFRRRSTMALWLLRRTYLLRTSPAASHSSPERAGA